MYDLNFWYLFLGFPIIVIGLCGIFAPKRFEHVAKGLIHDDVNLRLISVWYYTFSTFAGYSAYLELPSTGAKVMMVIATLTFIKSGVLQLFPEWYQKRLAKPALNQKEGFFVLYGFVAVLFGAILFWYGWTGIAGM